MTQSESPVTTTEPDIYLSDFTEKIARTAGFIFLSERWGMIDEPEIPSDVGAVEGDYLAVRTADDCEYKGRVLFARWAPELEYWEFAYFMPWDDLDHAWMAAHRRGLLRPNLASLHNVNGEWLICDAKRKRVVFSRCTDLRECICWSLLKTSERPIPPPEPPPPNSETPIGETIRKVSRDHRAWLKDRSRRRRAALRERLELQGSRMTPLQVVGRISEFDPGDNTTLQECVRMAKLALQEHYENQDVADEFIR